MANDLSPFPLLSTGGAISTLEFHIHNCIIPKVRYRHSHVTNRPTNPTVKRMLRSGQFSDLTLFCNGKEFEIHKVAAYQQSHVFSAAISAQFRESKTGTIKIKLFDRETLFNSKTGVIKIEPFDSETIKLFDSETGVIKIELFDGETVRRMVEFLYIGETVRRVVEFLETHGRIPLHWKL
ncbi:hypothetical protein TrVFT333_010958 [Trichoderma virens FT-333]|nr:hypothetical protein TrVFT333_010958 [Trichoderma virens FT-333]